MTLSLLIPGFLFRSEFRILPGKYELNPVDNRGRIAIQCEKVSRS